MMSSPGTFPSAEKAGSLRLLVAIASFGERNLTYLNRTIQQYKAMPMAVDVVVVSEAPKDLPHGVTVVVGLPSTNPWSLPFAHKRLFAENLDCYDLFIYSEDDMGVTEDNIWAFLRATEVLRDDEIAGFLRYEKVAEGTVWMPDAHSSFHWEPDSVIDRGGITFAKYTNEHAAFYILTQAQLRRAIASGGFVREPYEGKYDMLCAAATDPYTSCGFQKVVCISDLRNFLIRHMSDRYAGQMGLPLSSFEEQLETLQAIRSGAHPATTLCEVESKVPRAAWSKSYYEKPHETLLAMVPAGTTTVLSIGCGWGATEAALKQRGAQVTALPLDSVIGAAAARRGVKPMYGRLDDCLDKLGGEKFDCVLISNLLHLQRDPDDLFGRCAQFVRGGGSLVIDSPNFQRLGVAAQRLVGSGPFQNLRTFSDTGLNALSPGPLVRSRRKAGLSAVEVRWYDHSLPSLMGLRHLRLRLGRLTAKGWVFRGVRTPDAERPAM
jgi:2-polyprenyl-3-methyl-5-hydroxy-6-metoxy-1,4-benzoquinol methylase